MFQIFLSIKQPPPTQGFDLGFILWFGFILKANS